MEERVGFEPTIRFPVYTLSKRAPRTLTDWVRGSNGAYWAANRQGWSKEVTAHMWDGNIFWTKEKVLKDALKYKKRIDWQKKSRGVWGAAKRIGCYEEATVHMKRFY